MRIFISVGEPSGDLHGANLIRTLRERRPDIECVGFGGDRMALAGCQLLYPLCQLAVMWLWRVLANATTFLRLLSQMDRYFRHHRPDAVILIDYPGFNWWVAKRARFHGIPVFYFVPPQLWGWAGWRVQKMRRFVDHVLCVLPFEQEWYRQRGVEAHYVGHPYFDELPAQRLDAAFVADQQKLSGKVIGLLPGSRNQEIARNLSTMVRAALRIHAAQPDVRFLAACFKEAHRETIANYLRNRNLPIELHVGKTPEIIHLAQACVAVSGSVGLELLYRVKPTVVVYRIPKFDMQVCRLFKTSRYISLVNLLADEELFPEFLTDRCEAEAISGQVLEWLTDAEQYTTSCRKLKELRQAVAVPGACDRAARFVLERLAGKERHRTKAA